MPSWKNAHRFSKVLEFLDKNELARLCGKALFNHLTAHTTEMEGLTQDDE